MTSPDPGSGAVPYRFTIEGFDPDHFRVHAFTGREALSEPYVFDVVLTAETEADEEVERIALGRRAVLTWTVGTLTLEHGSSGGAAATVARATAEGSW